MNLSRRDILRGALGTLFGLPSASNIPIMVECATKNGMSSPHTCLPTKWVDGDYVQVPTYDLKTDIRYPRLAADFYMSPEMLEDIRNWNLSHMNDAVTKEIFA